MSINIGPPAIDELRPRIVVFGVGGAGGNAIANMIAAEIEGVDFVVANTDAQALNNAVAENRIQLGPDITQGLGAGSRPEVGRAAAEETLPELERLLEGVHMCFIAAGMGGGTGTGAAPIIARAAREKGVLTVGVVTKPFLFEGTRRMRAAEAGIEELQKEVDTLIVIPNQNLFLVAKAETTFKEAFQLADEVLQQGVRSITDLMVMPGLINLDFADVRSVMGEMGKAMMGTGEGEGPNRALEAAERAIANPLLDGVSMQGAKGVIISIIGGEDMKLLEVDEAANHIRELVDADANIIWGSAFNPDLQGRIRVSVVATGIEQSAEQAEQASRPVNLGMSRGPMRPAATPTPASTGADVQPLFERGPRAPVAPSEEQQPEVAAEEPLDLAGAEQVSSGSQDEYASELELDAGQEVPAAEREEEAEDETANGSYASLSGTRDRAEPLELGLEQAEKPAEEKKSDELLLDADRLAERDAPVTPISGRRRPLVGSQEAVAQKQPEPNRPQVSGSTLFERMANLSRNSRTAEAEEDDEEAGSISIPRFLGRQNNQ
ncbi:cell division protein FtsZ [Novosphingobium sp. PC22D]|uniref:cell division protein FtsZ n=1 Tax=Novosphingobium sp. PC22D TaxID=1962403 RepID=UPI000BF17E95|nr:cell division protein FtsZ [Novosphingobium sp. PC22D]PEQ12644.1 cell division protein FtsZ [Novosphingobium sp. PC22D]